MERIVVLAGGGLDSAVLVADLAQEANVFPVYVEAGLAWEAAEKRALEDFLQQLANPNVSPVTFLELPMRRLYGDHWSITGAGVPGYDAPEIAIYLPGRNVLLIGVTAVWCTLHDIPTIAIGSLSENTFADATPDFFEDYGRLLSGALSHDLRVVAPYRSLHKSDLISRFPDLPLHRTLTCMVPLLSTSEVIHCGACFKCQERQDAFEAARVADKTVYAA